MRSGSSHVNFVRISVLCVFFLTGLFFSSYGQQLPAPKGCGYDHYVHQLDKTFPGFKKTADQLFERPLRPSLEKNLQIYTIPVVVHVVWKEEEENIPDSLIYQVLDVLNEDYRRKNADADSVRAAFLDVVGDPGIEFELAAIERVKTDTTFELNLFGGSLPDNVKLAAYGGSDAWDPDKYLNIWVCNIQGGSLLGYAYPPADLENWPEEASAPSPEVDGVVIHYPVFRRTGEYTASGLLGLGEQTVPVRGRTVTHEVGHYLGLRHIWGDGLLSILGLPDCDADDGVADTPNQGTSSQFACDPEQNTCSDEENDMPDMFENYMDYASETCLNSFTKNQISIMRSVLENERKGLIGAATTPVFAIESTQEFKVYPNPVSEQLYVESSLEALEEYQLQLVDMQGRMVKSAILGRDAYRQSVDVSGLPAGLYGLLIRQKNKQYFQKVIIQ